MTKTYYAVLCYLGGNNIKLAVMLLYVFPSLNPILSKLFNQSGIIMLTIQLL